MKRQRDERLEPARLVLQRPRAQHVVHALLGGLDVAVEHRHVRPHAEPVGDAVDVQVAVGPALVVADFPADALGENLGAAAGQRVEPGRHQLAQHLLVRLAVEIGEEGNLHRGETLQMDIGPDALEAAQQLRVVVERQIGMQPVDDVDFGEGLGGAAAELVPGFVERHRVGAGVAGLEPRERAEEAARHADVGRLDADVVVVEGLRAVPLLAFAIGQPAHRQEVGTVEKPHTVGEIEPDAGIQLVRNVRKAGGSRGGTALGNRVIA